MSLARLIGDLADVSRRMKLDEANAIAKDRRQYADKVSDLIGRMESVRIGLLEYRHALWHDATDDHSSCDINYN